jgi:hypothetical protein
MRTSALGTRSPVSRATARALSILPAPSCGCGVLPGFLRWSDLRLRPSLSSGKLDGRLILEFTGKPENHANRGKVESERSSRALL